MIAPAFVTLSVLELAVAKATTPEPCRTCGRR